MVLSPAALPPSGERRCDEPRRGRCAFGAPALLSLEAGRAVVISPVATWGVFILALREGVEGKSQCRDYKAGCWIGSFHGKVSFDNLEWEVFSLWQQLRRQRLP